MDTRQGQIADHRPVRPSRRARVVRRVRRMKKATIFGAVVLIIVAIFLIANWPSPKTAQPKDAQQTSTPQYQTVLPSGKTIKDLGGWKKLTPPNSNPFYTYADSIDSVAVNVSQQQLPPSFQSNTNQKVAELAKSYNATSKLAVSGLTVYIGISAKGPQSVIFTKDNLLVFIQSKRKVSDKAWKAYITSLGIPSSTNEATY